MFKLPARCQLNYSFANVPMALDEEMPECETENLGENTYANPSRIKEILVLVIAMFHSMGDAHIRLKGVCYHGREYTIFYTQ